MEDEIIPVEDYFAYDTMRGYTTTSSILGSFNLSWEIILGSRTSGVRHAFVLDDDAGIVGPDRKVIAWIYKPKDPDHPNIVTVWNR